MVLINLDHAKIKKALKGQNITVTPDMVGKSGYNFNLHPTTLKKLNKNIMSGKGCRITLTEDELPEEISGEGIFGKKFDNALKKAGIKKAVYKAGDVVKPYAMQGIENLATNLITAQPELAPAVTLAKNMAQRYIDEPDQYQSKQGFKKLVSRSATDSMTGQGLMTDVNKGLKKLGIKKVTHKAINEIKKDVEPRIHQSINKLMDKVPMEKIKNGLEQANYIADRLVNHPKVLESDETQRSHPTGESKDDFMKRYNEHPNRKRDMLGSGVTPRLRMDKKYAVHDDQSDRLYYDGANNQSTFEKIDIDRRPFQSGFDNSDGSMCPNCGYCAPSGGSFKGGSFKNATGGSFKRMTGTGLYFSKSR